MSNVFILHGSFGSPYDNWFGWLRERLSSGGVAAFAVPMPTPAGQSYEAWAAILDGYRAAGVLNADSYMVTHSSAGMFAVRYVATANLGLKGLTTVAGFDGFESGDADFDNINRTLFTRGPDDFAQAKRLVPTRHAFYADDDPYLPQEVLRAFAAALAGGVTVVPAGGHLSGESGYRQFDLLFDQVSDAVVER